MTQGMQPFREPSGIGAKTEESITRERIRKREGLGQSAEPHTDLPPWTQ